MLNREGRSNSASAMTSPFHTSPESPRANVSPTSITSPSHPSFPSVEFITSSSPLSLSYSPNADSSGTNSAPSSPSSIRRSAGSRKSLNLSSLASSLHRSPTQKTVSSFIILSVQVPVLARKKKINFCNTDNVKEALQVIKNKYHTYFIYRETNMAILYINFSFNVKLKIFFFSNPAYQREI